MKKYLLSFILLVLSEICLWSQTRQPYDFDTYRNSIINNTNKYLTIKGIELRPGLKMDDLLHQLESKGCKKTEDSKFTEKKYGIYYLDGPFFSRTCNIMIMPTNSDKTIVGMIAITFPEKKSFKQLKEEYDELKAALSEKYCINECTESFDYDYISNSPSDELKLQALSKNEATFQTKFYLTDDIQSLLLGQVSLNISSLTVNFSTKYNVSLVYTTPDSIYEQLKKSDDL